MRKYTKSLLGAAFLILAACFLLSMSCSWDIVTRGEVLKSSDATFEDLRILEEETSVEIPELELTDDIPDSLRFKVFSEIVIDGETFDFVEMEVGEILPGTGGENDTLMVDHRP